MSRFNRLIGKSSDGLVQPLGVGDSILNPAATTQATDANSVITAAALLGGLYIRSGMTAGRTDTTDTAVAILAAVPSMDIGDSMLCLVSVTVAFALTLAGGVGVTIGAKTSVAASGSGILVITKTSATTVSILVL